METPTDHDALRERIPTRRMSACARLRHVRDGFMTIFYSSGRKRNPFSRYGRRVARTGARPHPSLSSTCRASSAARRHTFSPRFSRLPQPHPRPFMRSLVSFIALLRARRSDPSLDHARRLRRSRRHDRGRGFQQVIGANLENARILLEPYRSETFTDGHGRYRFSGRAGGTARIGSSSPA